METENGTLRKQIKKSDLHAKTIFDYEFLLQKRMGLIPCKMEELEEEIVFDFDIEGLHPFAELREEELESRYRFLQNLTVLQEICKYYHVDITEENLYYDYNYIPYIAVRDIKEEDATDFFLAIKELAAGILSKKYDYTQIHESGIEIVSDDKQIQFLFDCENEEDFFKEIQERAQQLYLVNREQKIRIDKKRYFLQGRITIGVIAVLVLLLVFTGYRSFVVLPKSESVIRASRNFVVQNYMDCIDALKKIKVGSMDTYTKYILAVSYAKTEALEKEELGNVLERLSIYSNEIELEYWIAIGRSDFERAENIAMALSDDKLLIYAYMKELNYLEGNVTMDGEEKQNRIAILSNEITAIGKKYEESEN